MLYAMFGSLPSSPVPGDASAMEDYVSHANIKHFEELINAEADVDVRVRQLLSQEKMKVVSRDAP